MGSESSPPWAVGHKHQIHHSAHSAFDPAAVRKVSFLMLSFKRKEGRTNSGERGKTTDSIRAIEVLIRVLIFFIKFLLE